MGGVESSSDALLRFRKDTLNGSLKS